ncbi:salt tolerance down-regulator-domain-containing protein [Hypoxylon rubiginosum]|uniref:Salt tolerance down-regulator-domain-containing protein n=1 Tax=Hypoxylon rubiginosum TaxID=110542 RepID=A0ACC0D165_9PEZI|nr:salt tolerance down-regulator-domain-containing protein [Hypoxylon rubiginosum]
MPTNNNRQPASGNPPKTTAKYTNKDGTKYISVPKSSTSTPSAQPSPTTTSSSRGGGAPTIPSAAAEIPLAQPVNRKKQKRRAKAAAKAAAEQAEAAANGLPSPASTNSAPLPIPAESQRNISRNSRNALLSEEHSSHNHVHDEEDWGEETESDDDHHHDFHQSNGTARKGKKSKGKKKKKGLGDEPASENHTGISKEKIWNTSGPEERERIKQFWLGLGEDERKSLVKVEKDAVLKKMKEQQKHTCSCSVCGRKRTAIEEELEGLYDAYYQELESFANQPHNHPNAPPMFSPKRFGPMSGLHPPGALPSRYSNHHPSHGRIVEHVDNDEEDEEDVEEYSDVDGLDEEEDEEDEPEEIPRDPYPNDFFNFGQSLTVKGGILTVADDLLKNDGKKFIEMMEQLAERRMAREEDAKDHYTGGYGHAVNGNSLPNPHNHPPPEDEEFDEDEEEEEEYDSQDEDYEEEEDTMTEEQRMEEGRRMFQIFAARMFEQRVLTAYREKVARERQDKLIEELEQEKTQESQRKAKKAKETQKRKDKAAQKKQAQLEEKAKRDAAKAEEDAARLAEEAKKAEEARFRAEEKRKKKDAQKKAEEEERVRREQERQRRAHEQKEKQAEQERKAREAREREKKLKEEQRRKEQEARELKDRETRERREKHEKDKREKELRAAQAKAERDAKEKAKQEEKEKAAAKAATPVAPIPTQPAKKQNLVSIPAIPHQQPTNHPSPQVPVATPALPKAPTPIKPRSTSQEVPRSVSQASHSASGPSQNVSPHTLTPLHTSPGPIGPPRKASANGPMSAGPPAQPASPLHAGVKSPPGLHQTPFNMGMPPVGMPFPPGMPPMGPAFNRMHTPIFPPVLENMRPMGMSGPPPGFSAPNPMGGRPFGMPPAPPGFAQPGEPLPGMHHQDFSPESVPRQPSTHSRQASASFDASPLDMKGAGIATQPIGRPTPIGRPGSVVHGQKNQDLSSDIDDVSNHLGSSALLDDSDEPFGSSSSTRRGTAIPGARPSIPSAPFLGDGIFGSPMSNAWGPPNVFSPPPGFANPAWPPNPTFGHPPPSMMRASAPRSVAVRQMLVRSCKDLAPHAGSPDGYIDISSIKGHVDSLNFPGHDPVSEAELLDMCETEGNTQNGGGTFDVRHDESGRVSIKFEPDAGSAPSSLPRNLGAPGEIGSPIVGHSSPRVFSPRA